MACGNALDTRDTARTLVKTVSLIVDILRISKTRVPVSIAGESVQTMTGLSKLRDDRPAGHA